MQDTKFTLDKIISYHNEYAAHATFNADLNSDLLKTTEKSLFLEKLEKEVLQEDGIHATIKNVVLEIIRSNSYYTN